MISSILLSKDAVDWRTDVGLSDLFKFCGKALFSGQSTRSKAVHSYDLSKVEGGPCCPTFVRRGKHFAVAIPVPAIHS
jgi:hypothetical protein